MSDCDATHEPFLRRAFALAHRARAHGNHPFGAVLVIDGAVICEAENAVITNRDRSEHAELRLVRLAEQRVDAAKLHRATVYASTEPCVMCAGALYWTGIARVVFGFSAIELGALAGPGLLIPCREVLARGARPVEVIGPLLADAARLPHQGFWR
jgi:tRNA(Arg) A34 adenosine deaminase TadA